MSRVGPRAKSFQIRNYSYHRASWLSLQWFHPGVTEWDNIILLGHTSWFDGLDLSCNSLVLFYNKALKLREKEDSLFPKQNKELSFSWWRRVASKGALERRKTGQPAGLPSRDIWSRTLWEIQIEFSGLKKKRKKSGVLLADCLKFYQY